MRKDPNGQEYFWMTGEFKNYDQGEDTDAWALDHNFISIVPVQYDLTAHSVIDQIKEHFNEGI